MSLNSQMKVNFHVCLYATYTSNSLSSIAHKVIILAASGLLMALFKGWSVRTMMVWDWKYGLSFHAAVTSAKANFSILGYLSSAGPGVHLQVSPSFWVCLPWLVTRPPHSCILWPYRVPQAWSWGRSYIERTRIFPSVSHW